MTDKVISGGQSGVDQAALRAARACGLPTGGTAPKGWETEDGPAPWLADWGLVECPTPGYPLRTRANVRDADATIILGNVLTRGTALTFRLCLKSGKPYMVVQDGETTPRVVREWIAANGVRTLNVAGPRESSQPGIGARAEAFLVRVFRGMGGPGI